jgi:hypothetical protein
MDRRTMSMSFFELTNNAQVSYFVGVDASEAEPLSLLSGDRNLIGLTPSSNRICILAATNEAGWSREMHRDAGNWALGDGSVQQGDAERLRSYFREVNIPPQRLAVP